MKIAILLLALASNAWGQCPTKTDARFHWVQTSKGIEIYVDQFASNDDWWVMILLNRSHHKGIRFLVVGPHKSIADYAPIPNGDCVSLSIGKDEKIVIQ